MRLSPTVREFRPERLDHVPAMCPRSPRQVRTSSQWEITARSPFDHVTRECLAKRGDGPRSRITSLPSRPCLGLLEERSQLGHELVRVRSRAVESCDPRESLEDGT